MTSKASATFRITGWDENPAAAEAGKPKLTRAHVTCSFSGDIEGDGVTDYLMVYPSDDQATFVGLQQISGTLGGAEGTVVLQVIGTFSNSIAAAELSVVAGSGTGGLQSLSGGGSYTAGTDGSSQLTLDYDLG